MARPRKEIDKKYFEKLCMLQCTEKEICSFFEVCEDTLNSWCKRNYKDEHGKSMNFSDIFEQKRANGKISLRRNQVQLSAKSATMAIWLGKQWLGQTDKAVVVVQEKEADPLSAALEALTHESE